MSEMESIGEFFEQSRESQGLTLEQVAALTRIQQRFIEALEKEDFAGLPERVFVKGFVRTYARALGLNEEEAVQRFEESSRSFYGQKEETKRRDLERLQADRKGKLNRNVVLILTGVALMGLVWFIFPYEQSAPPPTDKVESVPKQSVSQNQTPPDVSNSESVSTGQVQSSTSEDTIATQPASQVPANPMPGLSEQTAPSSSSAAMKKPADNLEPLGLEIPNDEGETSSSSPRPPLRETATPVVVGEGELTLELQATEMTWVVVRPDEGPPNEALLQPGETVAWKAEKQFTLTLGNAGGVNVRLNGQPRGPFGRQGVVIRNLVIKP